MLIKLIAAVKCCNSPNASLANNLMVNSLITLIYQNLPGCRVYHIIQKKTYKLPINFKLKPRTLFDNGIFKVKK